MKEMFGWTILCLDKILKTSNALMMGLINDVRYSSCRPLYMLQWRFGDSSVMLSIFFVLEVDAKL